MRVLKISTGPCQTPNRPSATHRANGPRAARTATEIAEDLGHLEQAAGLDLLHETAIAAVPGLLVDVDLFVLQDVVDLFDLIFLNDATQADLLGLLDRNQDAHVAVEHAQLVEFH